MGQARRPPSPTRRSSAGQGSRGRSTTGARHLQSSPAGYARCAVPQGRDRLRLIRRAYSCAQRVRPRFRSWATNVRSGDRTWPLASPSCFQFRSGLDSPPRRPRIQPDGKRTSRLSRGTRTRAIWPRRSRTQWRTSSVCRFRTTPATTSDRTSGHPTRSTFSRSSPFTSARCVLLISRIILPITYQPDLTNTGGGTSGFGDTDPTFFSHPPSQGS